MGNIFRIISIFTSGDFEFVSVKSFGSHICPLAIRIRDETSLKIGFLRLQLKYHYSALKEVKSSFIYYQTESSRNKFQHFISVEKEEFKTKFICEHFLIKS